MKIVILARKNLQYNTRVERQAKALVQAGHQVRIVTLLSGEQPPLEYKDGYEIIRIKLNPVHQRIPQLLSQAMGAIIRGIAFLERQLLRFMRRVFLILRGTIRHLFLFLKWGLRTLRSVLAKVRNLLRRGMYELRGLKRRKSLLEESSPHNPPGPLQDERSQSYGLSGERVPSLERAHSVYGSELVVEGVPDGWIAQAAVRCLTSIRQGLRKAYLWLYGLARAAYLALRGFIRWIAQKIKGGVRVSFRFGTGIVRWILRPLAQPATTLDFTLKAYRLLRKDPADIYQAHDSPALAAAYLLARRHKSRFLYDAVEVVTGRTGRQLGRLGTAVGRIAGRLWEGFFVKRAAAVITPTPVIADVLRTRYNIDPQLIMNCTWYRSVKELLGYDLRELLPIPKEKKILLYVGAISAPNGIDYLIRCLRYLPKEVALVLMGPMQARYEPQCKALVEAEGVQDRVFVLPPVPAPLVPCYASSADVGIVAYQAESPNNYATLPNKFFEYLMARLPIAAPGFPALSKIILEENIGVIYKPSNVKDIARAVQELLNPETQTTLKANLDRAAQKYSWENQARKLIELYDKLKQEHER